MWTHNYEPVAGSGMSAVVAAIRFSCCSVMLGVWRSPAWMSALAGARSALLVALIVSACPRSWR